MTDIQQVESKRLNLDTQVLLLSYWETLRDLIPEATPKQMGHIRWLEQLGLKLEVKLKR